MVKSEKTALEWEAQTLEPVGRLPPESIITSRNQERMIFIVLV